MHFSNLLQLDKWQFDKLQSGKLPSDRRQTPPPGRQALTTTTATTTPYYTTTTAIPTNPGRVPLELFDKVLFAELQANKLQSNKVQSAKLLPERA